MKASLLALGAILLSTSAATAALPIYQSNFDATPYVVNETINNKGGWTVGGANGATAVVRAAAGGNTAAQGANYVELSAGAQIDLSLDALVSEANDKVLWVEGYFKGAGSETTLANATYPDTQASAIVHFSKTNGIEFLNGNKDNSAGSPVASGVALNAANWYKITIRLDFNTQTWDVWVNGTQTASHRGLGFKSNAVPKLRGFKNLAQDQAFFDAFRVVKPLAGDANGDTKVDSADVVAAIQLKATPGTDPIVLANADVAAPAGVNDADVATIVDLLTQ